MSAIWDSVQTNAIAPFATAPAMVIPLPNDAVLTVHGADARKFLQGQSTTDFAQVSASQSRLGCIANLKGRAIVSFRAVEWQENTLHLLMDAPLVATAKTLLQKFIVFSKAQLSTPELAVIGVIGEQAAELLMQVFGVCPADIDDVTSTEQAAIVRAQGENRFVVLVTAEALASVWPQLTAKAAIGTLNHWRLAQIAAGETQVVAETTELYQPQELNFPALNGVSYTKGCYTGQEIIARLHFRGKLKQWSHRFSAPLADAPALNSTLVDEEGRNQGHVVLTAQHDAETVEMLAIVRHDYKHTVMLEDGKTALVNLPLPYVIEAKE